jgi:spore coat polysaccharide biosynthesis protein SpsF (cytidylyltransferase family)
MVVAAVVQARTGSTRLPGKVLREVGGKPLLAYLLERLEHAALIDAVVVATSDDPSDEAVAGFCSTWGVECHRGQLGDVAGRILGAARARDVDAFVRISGDSPLLDQSLVDRAVALLRDTGNDIATNVHPRTFPHGQSVEAFRTDAFARGYEVMRNDFDLEHASPFFYRHENDFRIASFEHHPDISGSRLVVDTQDDLETFSRIVSVMERPHWDYALEEVLELHRACVA